MRRNLSIYNVFFAMGLLGGGLFGGAGCGGSAQETRQVAALNLQKRALEIKLEELRGLAQRDTTLRDRKKITLEEAQLLVQTDLSGQGAFFAFHKNHLTALVNTLLPATLEQDGLKCTFASATIELLPIAIQVKLRFRLEAGLPPGSSDGTPEGWLQGRLDLRRQGDGRLELHFTPETVTVDDRHYRVARTLQQRCPADRFQGLLPPLPLPLTLPEQLSWHQRTFETGLVFDPARVLILPERILIPFTLHPRATVTATSDRPGNFTLLLPDYDGKIGRVTLTNPWGNRTIETAGEAVGTARDQAPGAPFRPTEEEVRQVFGAALDAAPPPPERFILYFKLDTHELTEESQADIPRIIEAIARRPAPDVGISGHTDTYGDEAYNQNLAMRRAEVVRDHLVRTLPGIKILECVSHGKHNPMIPTEDGVKEPRNRRVEVLVR